jgi:predicted nuclease of predicted toxin-antitoxin system
VNLFADESVDRQIVERLRQDSHHVPSVAEMEPGISDDVVLARANQESAMLLTADKDFCELVFRQKRVTSGVILVRLAGLSPERKAQIVSSAIRKHSQELTQAFTVIMPRGVRIRRGIPQHYFCLRLTTRSRRGNMSLNSTMCEW